MRFFNSIYNKETFMKKKNKNATIRKKKEFRYHKVKVKNKSGKDIDIKHPCYIFLQIGNIYIYVSLTHSSNINGLILIELRENPNSLDLRKSYWIQEIKADLKSTFTKVLKKWKINKDDDADIRNLFDKKR